MVAFMSAAEAGNLSKLEDTILDEVKKIVTSSFWLPEPSAATLEGRNLCSILLNVNPL